MPENQSKLYSALVILPFANISAREVQDIFNPNIFDRDKTDYVTKENYQRLIDFV